MAAYGREKLRAPDAPQYIELVLNEIAADQAVFRITLQTLLLNAFASRPETAASRVAELKDQVLRSIARIPPDNNDAAGAERWKRLTTERAEQLFGELEDAVALPTGPQSPVSQ